MTCNANVIGSNKYISKHKLLVTHVWYRELH